MAAASPLLQGKEILYLLFCNLLSFCANSVVTWHIRGSYDSPLNCLPALYLPMKKVKRGGQHGVWNLFPRMQVFGSLLS